MKDSPQGYIESFVGQIGKQLGCKTVGLTGNAAKVTRCLQSYRYNVAINYKEEDWEDQLRQALLGGADIYFDNTGGYILDVALRLMAVRGRIVQCGTAAISSWTPPPVGPRNEREILTKRLRWGGFVIFDHIARFPEAATRLTDWYQDGSITYDEDVSVGIECAPGSIAQVYAGANSGKKIIDVTCG